MAFDRRRDRRRTMPPQASGQAVRSSCKAVRHPGNCCRQKQDQCRTWPNKKDDETQIGKKALWSQSTSWASKTQGLPCTANFRASCALIRHFVGFLAPTRGGREDPACEALQPSQTSMTTCLSPPLALSHAARSGPKLVGISPVLQVSTNSTNIVDIRRLVVWPSVD